MERIIYRKTLDTQKNGIQFTLQGFETADNMARTIELSLMASGDTIDLPLEQLSAIMYVTTPNSTEPSINECTIKDNVILYEVLPIVEEGITEMQLKLIETRPDGAKGVLMSPKFAVEVTKSNADDESVTQATTYTALENAIASAKAVYDTRILRVEIDTDRMFRVVYADGTVYETDVLNETLLKGEAVLSQSYARGGTGTRTGEDTDNSLYYANVSKSASIDTQRINNEAKELLDETRKHGVYTAFSLDFESGEIKYISPAYKFNINKENGDLEAKGQTYTPEETVELVVTEWLNETSAELNNWVKNIDEFVIGANSTMARVVEIVGVFQEKYNLIDKHESNIEGISAQITDIWENIHSKPYMVESGTSDIWYYEKWSNGIIKLFGYQQKKGNALGQSLIQKSGHLTRICDIKFELPDIENTTITNIRNVLPQVNCSHIAAWGGQGYSGKDDNNKYYVCTDVFLINSYDDTTVSVPTPTASTNEYNFNIEVIAKWQ